MKEKVTITVNTKLLEWIDQHIEEYKFGTRSHAFEYAVNELIRRRRRNIKN